MKYAYCVIIWSCFVHSVTASIFLEGPHPNSIYTLDPTSPLNDTIPTTHAPPTPDMLRRLKLVFLLNLPPQYPNKFQRLYQTLNENRLLDSIQAKFETILEIPSELFLSGFRAWLLDQDMRNVIRWMEYLDEYSDRFQTWLDDQGNFDDFHQSVEDNDHVVPSEDGDSSLVEIFTELMNMYSTILENIGRNNLARVGELFFALDRDAGGMHLLKLLIRIISIESKLKNMVIHSGKCQQVVILQKIADWILTGNEQALYRWLEMGNNRLQDFLEIIGE